MCQDGDDRCVLKIMVRIPHNKIRIEEDGRTIGKMKSVILGRGLIGKGTNRYRQQVMGEAIAKCLNF